MVGLVLESVLVNDVNDCHDHSSVSDAHLSHPREDMSLHVLNGVVHGLVVNEVVQLEDDMSCFVGSILPLDGVVHGAGGSVSDDTSDLTHEDSEFSGLGGSEVASSDNVPRFVGSPHESSVPDELGLDDFVDVVNNSGVGDSVLPQESLNPSEGRSLGHASGVDEHEVVERLQDLVVVVLHESELVEHLPGGRSSPHASEVSS